MSKEDKLEDTYNIRIQICKILSHFTQYNKHDVMKVTYISTSVIDDARNLRFFALYSMVSEKEVVMINKWCNKFTLNLWVTLELLNIITTPLVYCGKNVLRCKKNTKLVNKVVI